MEPQVKKEYYDFRYYNDRARWASYFYQICLILDYNPASVLEVGGGGGILESVLRSQDGIKYVGVDIAADLNPDIVANVTDIPVPDRSFDVVVAFEILEHLPFEQFEIALQELQRVSQGPVLISLPHFGPPIKFLLKIPLLREIAFSFKIPYYKQHKFNGQHYWEIGKRGYSARKIKEILEKYFVVKNEFVPFENQYHHFYELLRKK